MIWDLLGEEGNSRESRKTNVYRYRENFQQNSTPIYDENSAEHRHRRNLP